jgi:hypothetical protein
MTKREILTILEAKSKGVLERLLNYADLLLIPEEDLLINVTFQQMLDKVNSLADTHFPTWTDRSHTDFGRFLAELFCLFSEKDFYYANLHSRESFLNTSKVYSNAYYKSIEMGRVPITRKAATTRLRLTFLLGAVQRYPAGSFSVEIGGEIFSNVEPVYVPASVGNVDVIVKFGHGVFASKTTPFKGRSIRILEPNVIADYTFVESDNISWSRTDSFATAESGDALFLVLPEEDASCDILFGESPFGLRPNVGTIFTVKFLKGGGIAGNLPVSPATVTAQPLGSPRLISTVTMLLPASGGTTQESIEEIKARASLYFFTQNRVVNPADAVALILGYGGFIKAYAYCWGRNLYIYAQPTDGSIATPTQLTALGDFLQPITVMGYTVVPSGTTYINCADIALTVFVQSGYAFATIETEVRQIVDIFFDPVREADYGKEFVFSALIDFIVSNVEGVSNVTVDTVQSLPSSGFAGGKVAANHFELLKRLTVVGTPTVTTTGLPLPTYTNSEAELTITVRNVS